MAQQFTTRHDYLKREIREWLRTESAANLAAGGNGNPTSNEYEYASLLGLRWQDHSTARPLTPASLPILARFIADPDQPVCDLAGYDADDPDPCGGTLAHVYDSSAVAAPTVIGMAWWHELAAPTEEKRRWMGPHAHGRVEVYRDHGGAEYARWTDTDPTKGAAWFVGEQMDVDEAMRLIGLRSRGS